MVKSSWLIFFLVWFMVFCVLFKKFSPSLRSQRSSPLFSSRRGHALPVKLRCIEIKSEILGLPDLIIYPFSFLFSKKQFCEPLGSFYIWCEVSVKVHLFTCGYPGVLTPFVGNITLFPLNCLGTFCWKSIDHICLDLFLDCPFCSIDLYVCLYALIPHHIDYCSFTLSVEIGSLDIHIYLAMSLFIDFIGMLKALLTL